MKKKIMCKFVWKTFESPVALAVLNCIRSNRNVKIFIPIVTWKGEAQKTENQLVYVNSTKRYRWFCKKCDPVRLTIHFQHAFLTMFLAHFLYFSIYSSLPLTIILSTHYHCCNCYCLFSPFPLPILFFFFLFSITKFCISLFAKSHRCDDIALIFPLNFLDIESICMDSTNRNSIESMSIRLENAKCLYLVNLRNAFECKNIFFMFVFV